MQRAPDVGRRGELAETEHQHAAIPHMLAPSWRSPLVALELSIQSNAPFVFIVLEHSYLPGMLENRL